MQVIAEWLEEVVRLEDNVADIAMGLVCLGPGATTISDVACVKEEEMGQMGVTVDGDPVLLPVPAAIDKLRRSCGGCDAGWRRASCACAL